MARSEAWRNNRVVRYLRDTRTEMRKVHWPTRAEAWNLTKIVISVTVAMAVLLGVLDYVFALELGGLVGGNVIALAVLGVIVVAAIVTTLILRRQAMR